MERSDYIYVNDPQDTEGWNSDPFKGQRWDAPLGDVTDFPQHCMNVSTAWLPYILGALERLKFGDMWNGDAAEMLRIESNISTLQAMLADGDCPGGNFDYTCGDYPLYSPNITFLPSDPYDPPSVPPLGYEINPWGIANFDEPLNGIQAGDVILNQIAGFLTFPPFLPVSGVPRFQVAVEGPADVDLELVKVPFGGVCIILKDGVPAAYYDLQLYGLGDLLAISEWSELFGLAIGNLIGATTQVEIAFDAAGPHTLEVQFFPRVGITFNLGWGGGIRKVQICSAQEQIDVSGIVQDIRINGGTVEKQVSGAWSKVDVADDDDVLTGTDLRANVCQLQYYDLETGTWQNVPSATFYNTQIDCDLAHRVNVNYAGPEVFRAAVTGPSNVFQVGYYEDFWRIYGGLPGLLIRGANTNRILFKSDGSTNFVRANTDANLLGGVVINDNAALTPLWIKSSNAGAADILRLSNNAGTLVSQISQQGWFSAIQQLIVNDLSSTSAKRAQGRVLGQWADSTDATRKGRVILQADDFNGVREGLRVEADGGFAKLGFFGGAAITQPIVLGSDVATALQSLITAFDGMGLIDDQSTFGASEAPYGESPMQYTDVLYNFDEVTLIPYVWTSGGGFGDWIQGEGFVSELNGGTPSLMRLHVGTTTKPGLEVWRISGELLVASGAGGDCYLQMGGPGGLTISYFLGTVNGPELFTFEIAPAFQYLSNQAITFVYSEETSDPDLQVTLQKLRVIYKGIQPIDYIGAGNDITVYNFTTPDFE